MFDALLKDFQGEIVLNTFVKTGSLYFKTLIDVIIKDEIQKDPIHYRYTNIALLCIQCD